MPAHVLRVARLGQDEEDDDADDCGHGEEEPEEEALHGAVAVGVQVEGVVLRGAAVGASGCAGAAAAAAAAGGGGAAAVVVAEGAGGEEVEVAPVLLDVADVAPHDVPNGNWEEMYYCVSIFILLHPTFCCLYAERSLIIVAGCCSCCRCC